MDTANERVRRATRKELRCFPGQLERIIAKALGRSRKDVRLTGVLGCGGCNLVLELSLAGSPYPLAVRVPQPENGPSFAESEAGYAAALVLQALQLPGIVPETIVNVPLPHLPPRRGHLTILRKVDGKTLCEYWNRYRSKDPPMSFKKQVLADLVKVIVATYRRPFPRLGGLVLVNSPGKEQGVELGAMHDMVATVAKFDKGAEFINPGPYSSWKEFALEQIKAIEFLHGKCRMVGDSIRANCDVLRGCIHRFPGCDDTDFYLVHPDVGFPQILVNKSGQVNALLDWDGANTGPLQALVWLPDAAAKDNAAEELREFFYQKLAQAGAPELVATAEANRIMDPKEDFRYDIAKSHGNRSMISNSHIKAAVKLFYFCLGLHDNGILTDAEKQRLTPYILPRQL